MLVGVACSIINHMTAMRNWDTSTVLTTGGEEELEIITLRNEFFEYVHKNLGFLRLATDNPFVEFSTKTIYEEKDKDVVYSDDFMHRMVVCNQLIAMVFDRRNDGNCHEVAFWQRSPSGVCADQVAEIVLRDAELS